MSDVVLGSRTGRFVIAAAVLGSGMALLDGTVVNVALVRIGEELGASLAELQWITNGYLLALASLILLGGSLGDRFGRRRVFVIWVVWFTVASAACGLAQSPVQLIVGRVLQGVGGALLTPGSPSSAEADEGVDGQHEERDPDDAEADPPLPGHVLAQQEHRAEQLHDGGDELDQPDGDERDAARRGREAQQRHGGDDARQDEQ